MAGLLNAVYLVVAVGIAVLGLGAVASMLSDAEPGEGSWVELSAVAIAVLFVLALGVEFIA